MASRSAQRRKTKARKDRQKKSAADQKPRVYSIAHRPYGNAGLLAVMAALVQKDRQP
jgi:hypothetical protein